MTDSMIVGSWAAEPVQEFQQSGTANPQQWFIDALGGPESDSGVTVNSQTILTSGPVYQAVTILSSTLASLPITVTETLGGKNRTRENHAAFRIWNELGNEEMLPYHVRQTILADGFLHGNGLGAIHFEAGRPVGIYPLRVASVTLDRAQTADDLPGVPTGALVYRVSTDYGQTVPLLPHEVFHFKMLGSGLWGKSPLELFKNTVGNGLAMEKFQGKSFSNMARPSGVLQSDKVLQPAARQNLRREWNEIHQGLDNSNKIAVLWDGVTWQPMSVTSQQAEMLGSLKHYREQVAGIWNLPPHMLGAMENSAVRANIEEQNRTFVRQALIPHDIAFSQETKRKLCTVGERRRSTITIKHNFKALLRGDLKTRYESYRLGREMGWLSANDVLRLEDMDEIGPQGDVYLVPSNMANAATGEPFASAPDSSPDNSPDTDADFSGYLRKSLHRAQAVEVRNLLKAVNSKAPFAERVEKFYSTFGDYMLEPIEGLTTVSGFVDNQKMRTVVQDYIAASQSEVSTITNQNELQSVCLNWPARVDGLVSQLTESRS